MKKTFALSLIVFCLILAGCDINITTNTNANLNSTPPAVNDYVPPAVDYTNSVPAPTSTAINYILSTADNLKYCNGADMDSAGYKATITEKKTEQISESNLTLTQLANKTIALATQAAKINNPQLDTDPNNYIKVINDTAYVIPIEGWAGVSIFLCFWKPFVEVNLLQVPGIKNVVWVNDSAEWQNLK